MWFSRVVKSPRVVTVLVERLEFTKPVKMGQIIEIYGGVEEFGRTSIMLKMEVRRRNVRTEEKEIVVSTRMKFVRIDEYGSPLPISDNVKAKWLKKKEK